ncbi:fatty-acid amide hydrolase 2-A-like isoform X2 [Cylas formicarius]|uniref:fatty-acid amide hydrolase 2-A-like isoform X2 n=1 Tax=Cylas formicarius TaxID=197179 RepID=UPI002958B59D|nr:fatty-acid amide hydrolase 2-A-like isoform X2 [Cylas formicarius]
MTPHFTFMALCFKQDPSFGFSAVSFIAYVGFKAINVLYVPHFVYRLFRKPKRCVPICDDVLRMPAGVLAGKIRNREISCENVIQTYVARVREVNPFINAVIEDRFQEALEEARKVDELLTSGNVPADRPLLGLPLSVKGSLSVEGLRNTAGVVGRNDVAECDAPAVRRARVAGAIPLLTSNVPELCMDWETSNKLVGSTKNPYDVTRTAGGSSGGEASLLASGASLLSLGSDMAGSLRLPAHFCGVYGHKPSPGVVSNKGHYPDCRDRPRWDRAFVVGPMARYASDLRLLLRSVAVPEALDRLALDENVNLRRIKVRYLRGIDSYHCDEPRADVAAAVDSIVRHFANICESAVTELDAPVMKYIPEVAALCLLDIDDVENIFKGRGEGCFAELFRYCTLRSDHTLMAILYGFARRAHGLVPARVLEEARRYLGQMENSIAEALGPSGVLVMPVYPRAAYRHADSLRKTLVSGYLSIFNALGFPVTSCPVGRTRDGLPVGVQIVALPDGDRLTLAVAEEIERAFGGWKPPQ